MGRIGWVSVPRYLVSRLWDATSSLNVGERKCPFSVDDWVGLGHLYRLFPRLFKVVCNA